MPNRILRDAILTSERVAALDWPAEVFYRRLHSIVDDYGRHEAGQQLLRAKCYPLQTDSVRVADIARWMAACQKSGLILVYGANGKQYLEVSDFGQQIRSASKCPAPDINCEQVLANEHLGEGVFGDEGVGVGARDVTAEVLAAYHAALPACQQISVLNPKRRKRVGEAIRLAKQVCKSQGWEYGADFWPAYFAECAKDEWLRGDKPNPNNPKWRQNIDVLLAEDRFAEIMDRAIASMRAAP